MIIPTRSAHSRLLTLLLPALFSFSSLSPSLRAEDKEAAPSLYVDYSARPNPAHLQAHALNLLHPDAAVDFEAGHQLGNRHLAYLSLIEIAADATYRDAAIAAGVTLLVKNDAWNSDLVDLTQPAWRQFVVDHLAKPAAERGFDGFFLDTADSLRLLTAAQPKMTGEFRNGLLALIRELKAAFPEKSLVINRGFDLLPELGPNVIDGVLVESVFRGHDAATREYQPVEVSLTKRLTAQIVKAREAGYPVYVIDYVAPGDVEMIAETERQIRELGAIPFLTTPELNGTLSAGGQVARRILVLFGHDPAEVERHRIWPADTTTHAIMQMPLEHMGYEVDYHDVTKGVPTIPIDANYAGIILDEELELPYVLEHDFADWLLKQIDVGKKVLFLGSYAFSDHHERERIFTKLNIKGSDETPMPAGEPRIATIDEEIMNFESEVVATRRDFENLTAPEDARILLSLEANLAADGSGETARFDTAYLANWGGALLAPYLVFEASEETVLQYADPFALLGEIWPAGDFPAPDPTTRDGLRVFYTHIDGDGFSSLSAVDPGHTCAEVLYDRLLKDMPWPITVSVVEAEIRGHMLSQAPGESEKLTAIAKKIYELPHVEPATHSYSHPYLWIADDSEFEGLYDTMNLELKLTARYPKIDLKRETTTSIEYVTNELTPADKPAELLLWSGNCRPSPVALRELRSQGYENMNGGNTILCSRFPGLFGVAPRTVTWDGELQINAANQNEYLYTDGWNGPTWGGFAQVIETFEMTESPRRLKPVNVYYHFYSVERHDAYAALEEIYDWCRGEELHAMTALQFARITRDSWQTRLVKTGDRRWVALNDGQLRTFRIPADLGTPDLALSEGVTGFRREGGELYLHTDGSRRVTVQLADSPGTHPRIETASAEIRVDRLEPEAVRIRTLRAPAELLLGGFAPDARVEVAVNGANETHQTDTDGRLRLKAPAATTLSLTLAPR